MNNSDTEVICAKCDFYTDKFFAHKYKDNKSYCSHCYSKELEKLK